MPGWMPKPSAAAETSPTSCSPARLGSQRGRALQERLARPDGDDELEAGEQDADDGIAVGTAVAGGPPRRSRRARQRTGLLPWVLA